MTKIEHYAAKLVGEGGESCAEDDLDEGEEFEESEERDWRDATSLGVKMAQAIKRRPESFVAWFHSVERAEQMIELAGKGSAAASDGGNHPVAAA